MLDAQTIRGRLLFDVERLRAAAVRLLGLDQDLNALRHALLHRASCLADLAETASSAETRLRHAQAQATAHLAGRAAFQALLSPRLCLALMGAMATGRWIGALCHLRDHPRGCSAIHTHIEAGRVAYRVFCALPRYRDLHRSGIGQIVSAVIVHELCHPEDRRAAEDEIDEGLWRAWLDSSAAPEAELVDMCSRSLREAAMRFEDLAVHGEAAFFALRSEAQEIERKVARIYSF